MSATLPDLNALIEGERKAVRLITQREKYYENPVFAERVLLHYDLMKEKILFRIVIQKKKYLVKILKQSLRST